MRTLEELFRERDWAEPRYCVLLCRCGSTSFTEENMHYPEVQCKNCGLIHKDCDNSDKLCLMVAGIDGDMIII